MGVMKTSVIMDVDSLDSRHPTSTVDQWKSSVWLTSTIKSSVASTLTVDSQRLYSNFWLKMAIFPKSMFLSNFEIWWNSIFLIIYWIFRCYLNTYYSLIFIWCYYLVSAWLHIIFFSLYMCGFVAELFHLSYLFLCDWHSVKTISN